MQIEEGRLFSQPNLEFSDNPVISEEEVRSLYERLLAAIQDPSIRVAQTDLASLFSSGIHFHHNSHNTPFKDDYLARGLKTITPTGGRPGIGLSASYHCIEAETHQSIPIPEGTPVIVGPLAGLRERFIINGTLEGTGLKTSNFGQGSNETEIDTPLTRESFNIYRSYLEYAHFGPSLPVEYTPR